MNNNRDKCTHQMCTSMYDYVCIWCCFLLLFLQCVFLFFIIHLCEKQIHVLICNTDAHKVYECMCGQTIAYYSSYNLSSTPIYLLLIYFCNIAFYKVCVIYLSYFPDSDFCALCIYNHLFKRFLWFLYYC